MLCWRIDREKQMNGRKLPTMPHPPVALVTGASRGIGRAISMRLAEEGFHVVVNYRQSEKEAKELCAWISEHDYPEALPVRADVSNLDEVKCLFSEMKQHFGSLSVLVNNAGGHKPALFLLSREEDWWGVIDNNLRSVVNCCRLALPFMISQRYGVIINITSVSGIRGVPGETAYSASKAAITGFSKSLLREVSQYGISINCVAPGLIDTDMVRDLGENLIQKRLEGIQKNRLGDPQEVAEMVALLASGKVGYMLGQEIVIDGGVKL